MMGRLDREIERARDNRALLDRIEEAQECYELTSWEDGFLDDIHDRVLSGSDLTDDQESKLEEIEDIAANGRSCGE